jgi:hypothetical protein
MRVFAIALLLGLADVAKADDRPVSVPCAVWGNMKAATAGVIQVSLVQGDGKTAKGFDGYDAAIKLADDKARVCRFGGVLKLADQFLATYQFQTGVEGCLMLLELHRKDAVIHDRKGTCAQALCSNGMKLDNLRFTFDPNTTMCQGQRVEQPR